MRHLTRLNYPIVCDLLRESTSIPAADLAGAMLSETDEAFTVALEVLDKTTKQSLLEDIEKVETQLSGATNVTEVARKKALLQKTLMAGTDKAARTLTTEPG